MIHTTSTKCQYSDVASTMSWCFDGELARHRAIQDHAQHQRPAEDVRAVEAAVSVKYVVPNGVALVERPSLNRTV